MLYISSLGSGCLKDERPTIVGYKELKVEVEDASRPLNAGDDDNEIGNIWAGK